MRHLLLRGARLLYFVVVSHELPSIYKIADRVIMLDTRVKTIAATGKPSELRDRSDNPWVRQFLSRQTEGSAESAPM